MFVANIKHFFSVAKFLVNRSFCRLKNSGAFQWVILQAENHLVFLNFNTYGLTLSFAV